MFASAEAPEIYRQFAEAVEFGKDFGTLMVYAVVVGFVGFAVARTMHKNHVHWHWSLLVCGLLAVVFVLKAGQFTLHGPWILVPGLVLAAYVAMRCGRGWHQVDEITGGEQARIARERLTPGWTLRLFARYLGRRTESTPTAAPGSVGKDGLKAKLAVACACLLLWTVPKSSEEEIFLGWDNQNEKVYIPLKHMLLVGSTELGKTTTIRQILFEIARVMKAREKKMGAIVIDGKGDEDLEQALKRYAEMMGVPFSSWNPKGKLHYDPFAHGDDTEIRDRALAAEKISDTYYVRFGQRVLGFAAKGLRLAGKPRTLSNLARYLDPKLLEEELGALIKRRSPRAWRWFEDHLPDLKGREVQAVSGLQHRLAALSESGCGHLLEPDKNGHALDLLEAVRNGEVVYFDLHANANHDTATALGALIMSDLMSVFAVLQYCREVRETLIILDDAQGWVTEPAMICIASLCARARSAGAKVIIGTQSFEDLNAGDYGTMKRVRNLIKVTVVHGLPDPEAREQASKVFGEREETVTNWHVDKRGRIDGGGSQSSHWVRRIPPDELKHLEPGEAYVLVYPQEEPSRVCVEWVD